MWMSKVRLRKSITRENSPRGNDDNLVSKGKTATSSGPNLPLNQPRGSILRLPTDLGRHRKARIRSFRAAST